jgi:hypothetical protein
MGLKNFEGRSTGAEVLEMQLWVSEMFMKYK